MGVTIHRAVEQDYAVYCDLFFEINEQHRLALPDIFRQPPGSIIERDYFLSLLENEQAAIFFAGCAGQTAGYIYVLIREAPLYSVLVPRRYGVIDTLVVRPAFQRTGVGRALMQAAEDWAACQGIDRIELNVYEFNQGAQAFYRRLGYASYSHKMTKKLP